MKRLNAVIARLTLIILFVGTASTGLSGLGDFLKKAADATDVVSQGLQKTSDTVSGQTGAGNVQPNEINMEANDKAVAAEEARIKQRQDANDKAISEQQKAAEKAGAAEELRMKQQQDAEDKANAEKVARIKQEQVAEDKAFAEQQKADIKARAELLKAGEKASAERRKAEAEKAVKDKEENMQYLAREKAEAEAEVKQKEAKQKAEVEENRVKVVQLIAQERKRTGEKPVDPKDANIKVKGLYIGMDIQNVPALLKEKMASTLMADMVQDDVILVAGLTGNTYRVLIGSGLFGEINAGPDGKVTSILLNTVTVNDLFNASGMEASDFAKQFVEAYKIPQMDVSDNAQALVYTSKDGIKVTIDSQKNLFIVKVASAQERKKAFD